MLRIGSYELPSNILLAPMAGCTDLPTRLISREYGAKFAFFEMVDCNSITYGPKRKLRALLKTSSEDSPIAAQLLGRDPSRMLAGAEAILTVVKPAFLDVNAACPAKKVAKKKCGAYLLKEEHELSAVLKKLSSSLPIPVTVKLRTGYEEPDPAAIARIAKRCEDSGASAIFIHGRTKAQGYSGEIDYVSIKAVKDAVRIPVFGSGNVFSPELAERMFKETGCNGVLVARGALGNPWIFNEIKEYISKGHISHAPTPAQRKAALKKHIDIVESNKDRDHQNKVGHMRKIVIWYVKGFPLAARIREKVSLVNSHEKMIELVEGL